MSGIKFVKHLYQTFGLSRNPFNVSAIKHADDPSGGHLYTSCGGYFSTWANSLDPDVRSRVHRKNCVPLLPHPGLMDEKHVQVIWQLVLCGWPRR